MSLCFTTELFLLFIAFSVDHCFSNAISLRVKRVSLTYRSKMFWAYSCSKFMETFSVTSYCFKSPRSKAQFSLILGTRFRQFCCHLLARFCLFFYTQYATFSNPTTSSTIWLKYSARNFLSFFKNAAYSWNSFSVITTSATQWSVCLSSLQALQKHLILRIMALRVLSVGYKHTRQCHTLSLFERAFFCSTQLWFSFTIHTL